MLRKMVFGLVLTMLMLGVLTLGFDIQPVGAGTITVPDDYPTIQEAIYYASEGDTVFVKNGTYHENIVINKSVSLIGENRVDTILIGSFSLSRIEDVLIENFTIQNSLSFSHGISLYNSSNCQIQNNNITVPNGVGIYFEYECNNNTILENIISENRYGIQFMYFSSNNTIAENSFANNEIGIYLDYHLHSYNKIVGNNVSENDYGIYLSWNSNNNTIIENNVVGNSYGIYLLGCERTNLAKNNVTENQIGILLDNVYLSHYEEGLAQNNIIVENIVKSNTECGLRIINSTGYFGGEGTSLPNFIYHNIFIDNTNHSSVVNSTNVWDDGYPSGGNYWSDYNGTDNFWGINQDFKGYDMLGDTTYTIDENNTDRYPLTMQWRECKPPVTEFPDLNGDGRVNILDLSTVAIHFGEEFQAL